MRKRPFRNAYCDHCSWRGELYEKSPMGVESGPCPVCKAWGRLHWEIVQEEKG